MRKFLIILLLPSFLTIQKSLAQKKKLYILRKKFITFHNLTLVFILEKN